MELVRSSNRTLLLVLVGVLIGNAGLAQTFYKTIGSIGTDESAQCLQSTQDGNFVIGGNKGDSAQVTLVDPNGNVLWSRTFQAIPNQQNIVYQIASTAEGDLVGTGNSFTNNPYPQNTFLFKFDLFGNLIWLTRSLDNRPIWTNRIMPNSMNEYMILPCIYDLSSTTLSDLYTGTVDANSGLMLSSNPRTDFTPMNPGLDEHFSAVIADDQTVFACGRVFLGGNAIGSMRPHVTHFSPSGERLWAKYFMYPVSVTARIYGIDIILNDDSLTVCYFGDIDGQTTNYNAGLIRMDTLGNVAWTKDYNLAGYTSDLSYKVLQMPYGYAIVGYGIAPDRDLFVVALDLSGNVIWANSYGGPSTSEFLARTVTPNAVAIGSDILFTGTSELSGDQDIVLIRVDENGTVGCSTPNPISVSVTSIPPFSAPLNPMEYADNVPFVDSGSNSTVSLPFDLCAALSVDLGPDTSTCEPYALSALTPNASYLWSTGAVSSSIDILQAETVWVRVTVDCCTVTDTVIISDGGIPEAGISATVPDCGTVVALSSTSTGASELMWDMGDGTLSSDPEFEHAYSSPGSYTISLIAVNSCGVDSTQQSVTIQLGGSVEIIAPPIVCSDSEVAFSFLISDDFVQSFEWSNGSVSDEILTLEISTDTTVWINVVGVSGCVYSDSLSVLTLPLPEADFNFMQQDCGASVEFTSTSNFQESVNWNFGNGSISSDTMPTAYFPVPGTYNVLLVAENSCGTDTVSYPLTSGSTGVLSAGLDTTICVGSIVTIEAELQGANIAGTTWSTGQIGPTSIDLLIVSDTVVQLDVVDDLGCTYSNSSSIASTSLPNANFQSQLNPCSRIANFINTSSNSLSFLWDLGAGQPTMETDPQVSYPDAGPYSVILVASNSCGTDTTLQVISFSEPPSFEIVGPSGICSEAPITLSLSYSGTNDLNSIWSTGDTTSSITIVPIDGALIELNGSDDQGCAFHAEYTISFSGDGGVSAAYVPNVFTPNGDGFNEFFAPVIREGFKEMLIFNRWGQLIYETSVIEYPWKGDYKGQLVPDGTYPYIVRWKDLCSGTTEERVGHVTLLR